MTRALQQGAGHIISFIALFGIINSIGGLGGAALLGTYQVVREKANSAAIVQTIDPTDPIVAQRGSQAGGAGGRRASSAIRRCAARRAARCCRRPRRARRTCSPMTTCSA